MEARGALRELIFGAIAEFYQIAPADIISIDESEYHDRGMYGMADRSGTRVTITHRPYGGSGSTSRIEFDGTLSALIVYVIS